MTYRLVSPKNDVSSKQPGLLESGLRVPLGAATSILEAIPGSFGNIAKGVHDVTAAPLTKAITGKSIPYEETTFGKILPTTQQRKKDIEERLPYLKPKNKVENFVNEVAADTTELFTPGQAFKMGKYAFSPLRSLAVSLFGNIGGETVAQYTGDKNKGEMVKSLSMLAGSLLSPNTAQKLVSSLYKEADSLLPQFARINTSGLNAKLKGLESQILKGRRYNQLAPSEKFVIDEIKKVRASTASGAANVETIIANKRSLNENLQNAVFDLKDRASRTRAKKMATNINGYLRETLADYGKINPEWWKVQSAADKASGAVSQSNFVSRILEKYLKGRPAGLSHLFGMAVPGAVAYFSPMTGALTMAGYQGAKLGTRMIKSPELRKHYSKVVAAALADNPKVIHSELDKMEKEIEKEGTGRYRLKN